MNVPIEQSNFSGLILDQGDSYSVNVDAIMSDYISEMGHFVSWMIFFVGFSAFYSWIIHPWIEETFSGVPRLVWFSERISNVSVMLSRTGAMVLAYVSHVQGGLSDPLYFVLVGVGVVAALISVYSVGGYFWRYLKNHG